MAGYVNWLPGRRDDQLAMAKTWSIVLAAKGPAWGVPEKDTTELNTYIGAADSALLHAKSSDRSPVVTALCREAFGLLVEKMRYIVSVHNVDPLWTDYLKNRIFVAWEPKVPWRENARSVHKVTDFVDRH
ncbi:MAG: hypothetical protein LBC62_00995 [Treponema sp.]|jgi:hypothetical protein|nr:hypothetical protein [Treponema sp.]